MSITIQTRDLPMAIQCSLDLLCAYATPAVTLLDKRPPEDCSGAATDAFELICANQARIPLSGPQLIGLALLAAAIADYEHMHRSH